MRGIDLATDHAKAKRVSAGSAVTIDSKVMEASFSDQIYGVAPAAVTADVKVIPGGAGTITFDGVVLAHIAGKGLSWVDVCSQ